MSWTHLLLACEQFNDIVFFSPFHTIFNRWLNKTAVNRINDLLVSSEKRAPRRESELVRRHVYWLPTTVSICG